MGNLTFSRTIEELQQLKTPYSVITHVGSMDDNVQEHRAVVSNCSELVHSGDYVELHPTFCEVKIFLYVVFVMI